MLLPLLGLAVLLQGCLGLGRTSPVIPDRERPHALSQGVMAHVWMAQSTSLKGQVSFVDQEYYIPAGFIVFAPELIEPPSITTTSATASAVSP